ncbi:hypothetical protein NDU88_001929 [Pleurodeles waltl]|uniref:Uncharacterized protein n=1 Tax=Pleurodeles waltl TaxID=8319 RepID=A0AAV7RCL3_PLEWA|nr:hypothetical protein NDU88_001929 [Pleurodeles waltl]
MKANRQLCRETGSCAVASRAMISRCQKNSSKKQNVCKMLQGDTRRQQDCCNRSESTDRLTANRGGNPQRRLSSVKRQQKKKNNPVGITMNRNDGPAGTTQGRPQTQEPSKANSNGGSRVGGGACEDQALVASVKMQKTGKVKPQLYLIATNPGQSSYTQRSLCPTATELPYSSLTQGTLMK